MGTQDDALCTARNDVSNRTKLTHDFKRESPSLLGGSGRLSK